MPKKRMQKKKKSSWLARPLPKASWLARPLPEAYKVEYTGTAFTRAKIRAIKKRRKLIF